MVTSGSDPNSESKPATSEAEFISKGWALKSSGKFDDAEANFRKAISLNPESVEAYYGLGMTLKAMDRRQDSIQSFEKVLELIDSGIEDQSRGAMLHRLAVAHINLLRSGDWGLEKEIWKKK